MFSPSHLITAYLFGILLGCMFFYSLWFSTKKLLQSAHPIRWFVGAWLGRMIFTLSGFVWVSKGNWQLLVACLMGFVCGRWLISKFIVKNSLVDQTSLATADKLALTTKVATGAKHAP